MLPPKSIKFKYTFDVLPNKIFLIFLCLGYRPADDGPSEYQSIPIEKIEDFGVHCKQYYPLEITYFMSSLDSKM